MEMTDDIPQALEASSLGRIAEILDAELGHADKAIWDFRNSWSAFFVRSGIATRRTPSAGHPSRQAAGNGRSSSFLQKQPGISQRDAGFAELDSS